MIQKIQLKSGDIYRLPNVLKRTKRWRSLDEYMENIG